MTNQPKSIPLMQIIREFLGIAILHPEKPPGTQRQERDNQMMIIGYNKAQEDLRKILYTYGATAAVRQLSGVRHKDQQKPMEGPGGIKMWVAS